MLHWALVAFLLLVVLGGVARTGYRRRWYGTYNAGQPVVDGWAGVKIAVFALLLLIFTLLSPWLHLGVIEPR